MEQVREKLWVSRSICKPGKTVSDVIGEWTEGNLRVGIPVQAFVSGGSGVLSSIGKNSGTRLKRFPCSVPFTVIRTVPMNKPKGILSCA